MQAIDVATTYFVEGDVVKSPNIVEDVNDYHRRPQHYGSSSRVISRSASSLPRIGHPKLLPNDNDAEKRGTSAVLLRNKVSSPISILSSDIIPSVLKVSDEKLAYIGQRKSSSQLSAARIIGPKSNQITTSLVPHQILQDKSNYVSTSGIINKLLFVQGL